MEDQNENHDQDDIYSDLMPLASYKYIENDERLQMNKDKRKSIVEGGLVQQDVKPPRLVSTQANNYRQTIEFIFLCSKLPNNGLAHLVDQELLDKAFQKLRIEASPTHNHPPQAINFRQTITYLYYSFELINGGHEDLVSREIAGRAVDDVKRYFEGLQNVPDQVISPETYRKTAGNIFMAFEAVKRAGNNESVSYDSIIAGFHQLMEYFKAQPQEIDDMQMVVSSLDNPESSIQGAKRHKGGGKRKLVNADDKVIDSFGQPQQEAADKLGVDKVTLRKYHQKVLGIQEWAAGASRNRLLIHVTGPDPHHKRYVFDFKKKWKFPKLVECISEWYKLSSNMFQITYVAENNQSITIINEQMWGRCKSYHESNHLARFNLILSVKQPPQAN